MKLMSTHILYWTKEHRNKLLIGSIVLVAILIVPAYVYARSKMTMIMGYLWIMDSNITFNFVLLLFLYGVVTTKLTRHMTRRKQWLVWASGIAILILFFKYIGGFPTIIG